MNTTESKRDTRMRLFMAAERVQRSIVTFHDWHAARVTLSDRDYDALLCLAADRLLGRVTYQTAR